MILTGGSCTPQPCLQPAVFAGSAPLATYSQAPLAAYSQPPLATYSPQPPLATYSPQPPLATYSPQAPLAAYPPQTLYQPLGPSPCQYVSVPAPILATSSYMTSGLQGYGCAVPASAGSFSVPGGAIPRYPSSFSGGSFVVPPGGSYVPPVAYVQPSGSFVAPPGYVPPALGSSSYVPPIGTGSYVPPVTGSYVPPLATSGSFDGFGFPSTGSFVAPPGPVGLAKLRNKEFKFYVKPPKSADEGHPAQLAQPSEALRSVPRAAAPAPYKTSSKAPVSTKKARRSAACC
ncbi:unnamed protein product [Effrenium voratum]|nr:unnamed protein product [Effrenium voratum]